MISGLDGRMTNHMVARYRELEGRHLNPWSPRTFGPEIIALKVQTRQSNIYIAEAARTRVFRGDADTSREVARSLYQMEDYIQQVLALDVEQGSPARVEKMVSLFTSHDNAIAETLVAAGKNVARYPDFAAALTEHEAAWAELWDIGDIELPHEPRVQLLLRFHVSHVLQVCSRHTARHDAGVPARGLNGEAYRGHVFWDELYVYPYLNFRLPEVTRGLLMYRYRRLAEGGPRRGRLATPARCSRGRAAATAPRRRRSSISTRCPGNGTPTTAITSATSTRRSSTTSGSTTRPLTTWHFFAVTVLSSCLRSSVSGPPSHATQLSATGMRSTG